MNSSHSPPKSRRVSEGSTVSQRLEILGENIQHRRQQRTAKHKALLEAHWPDLLTALDFWKDSGMEPKLYMLRIDGCEY